MKKIISSLFILILFSLTMILSGCDKIEKELDDWSIFIYMCGSNLETKNAAATNNLREMLSEPLPDGVNFIVEAGGAKAWFTDEVENDVLNRILIKDNKLNKIKKCKNANMGDSGTLQDFLSWGIENYPAKKYGLVFWDHGNGSIDGVCNDENYLFDSLTLPEIDSALNAALAKNKIKFEFIGCDACLMANYSTAGLFSKYANYMYGSEEIEPSGGWDYKSLFNALNENSNIDGRELGIKICDGYYLKSLASKRSAIATMACLDLSLFDDLNKRFEILSDELISKSKSTKGLKNIAYGAKNSVKFGGSTEVEGYSNLIDLGSFVNEIQDLESKEQFFEIYDKFVVDHKAGSQKAFATGLSIFYPISVKQSSLDDYSKVCPCKNYLTFLLNTFSNIPKETIKFVDSGSIKENGEFSIEIERDSLDYLLSVDFNLVEYDIDDSSDSLIQISLGHDNDILWTKDKNNVYSSNFRGVWNTLNGVKLYNNVVESTNDYIIFDAPIRVNGVPSNLRYSFIFDDSYLTNGYYEIIGAWNGIDIETGMSDKDFLLIKPEDVIEVYYPYKAVSLLPNGSISTTNLLEKYVEIDHSNGLELKEDGLDGESYLYQFVITDVYGKKYYSNAGFILMNETRSHINSTVRVDGVFAGYTENVIRTNFKGIFDSKFIDSIEKFEEIRDKIIKNRINNKDNVWKDNLLKF